MIMAVIKNKKIKKSSEKKPEKELSKRQELNNHIVRMRNNVAQARVQIINRLIHQVKKYKARKGSEKEQEKAKRKAERLVEEIQILKKLKKDKASVYALQDSKTLDEVLNDPTSCHEERALSRISHHNVIKKKVNEYREANPNWDKQIPVLLAMTRAKRQTKKDPTSAESISNQAKSTPSGDRILPKFKKKPESINGARKIVASGSDSESDGEEPDSPPAKARPESDKRKKENGSPNPAKLPNLNRVEGTVKVKLLSNLNDLESDSDEEDKALLRLTQVPKSTKPKSGFFVGGVDKPEPKSFPTQQNDRYFNQNPNSNSTRNNSHQPKEVYRKGKLVSKPNFKPKPDFHKPQRSARPSPYDANSEPLNQNPKRPKFPGNTSDRLLQPPSASNPTSEKLHPSWEAKKKQQQITAFAGKRIVFGDDE